jgi:hypothetical protein
MCPQISSLKFQLLGTGYGCFSHHHFEMDGSSTETHVSHWAGSDAATSRFNSRAKPIMNGLIYIFRDSKATYNVCS